VINGKIAKAATAKQRADDLEYLELLKEDVAVAPIHSGLDGGMNDVFHGRFPWKIVPLAIVLPAGSGLELPDLPPVPWTDKDQSLANRLIGALLPSKPGARTQVAAHDGNPENRGTDSTIAAWTAGPMPTD
jgi:hypothetical protein